jgi:hypothetical protein
MARPEVTGRKVRPSERGTLAFSIPQAGRMIGLSRAASYQAARDGLIPVLEFNGRKIVPKVPWLRKLGVEFHEAEHAALGRLLGA